METRELIADRFEIEQPAGSGGMGVVYRAKDRQTGGVVALKILHGTGTDDAERFAREAQALAELRHPGIVKYISHGTTSSREHYLALEWLDGENLSVRLKRQRLSVADAITLGQRIAEALSAAHRRGIVHRDLKP